MPPAPIGWYFYGDRREGLKKLVEFSTKCPQGCIYFKSACFLPQLGSTRVYFFHNYSSLYALRTHLDTSSGLLKAQNICKKQKRFNRSSSNEGLLSSKAVFHRRPYFIEGRLPSKVVLHQRSSFIEGCLPLKVPPKNLKKEILF